MTLFNDLKERGYTNKYIAKRMKCNYNRAFRVLADPRLATAWELKRISKLLGVDFIDLCKAIHRQYWRLESHSDELK